MDNDDEHDFHLPSDFKGDFYQLVEGEYVVEAQRRYATRHPDDAGYWSPKSCTFYLKDWRGDVVAEHKVSGHLMDQVWDAIQKQRRDDEMEAAALRGVAA